jgi:dUTP pyrophosphatase
MDFSSIVFEKATLDAIIPTRASPQSAGLDLYTCESVQLEPRVITKISTGLRIRLCEGSYGRIVGRSSVTLSGILIMEGTLDSDYRGVVSIMAYNMTSSPIHINKNFKLAQLIVQNYHRINYFLVDTWIPDQSLEDSTYPEKFINRAQNCLHSYPDSSFQRTMTLPPSPDQEIPLINKQWIQNLPQICGSSVFLPPLVAREVLDHLGTSPKAKTKFPSPNMETIIDSRINHMCHSILFGHNSPSSPTNIDVTVNFDLQNK